jgi:hypothetical protein
MRMVLTASLLVCCAAPLAAPARAQETLFAQALLEPDSCTSDPFGDVGSLSPYCRWIRQAVEDGVMTACDAGATSFCPSHPVTREQLAVHLERALRGRVWGQGRPLTARYGTGGQESGLCINGLVLSGLSLHTTSWEGAAAACPQGTWVCTMAEVGICNTARPDSPTCDQRDCLNNCINRPANDQDGWVADAASEGSWDLATTSANAQFRTELGSVGITLPCGVLPVWCCSLDESTP